MVEVKIVRANPLVWRDYSDAVSDMNSIHREDRAAIKYGLEGIVAPGMWIASHIQTRENISDIKQIKFSGAVYAGDELVVEEKKSLWGTNYTFSKGEKVLCEVKGVKFGSADGSAKPLEEVLYSWDSRVSKDRINLFLGSLGFNEVNGYPSTYLASLSAPALLGLGSLNGLGGMHASQSFSVHKDWVYGPVTVQVGDVKNRRVGKGAIEYYELRWIQNEEIIASGRAGVLPLDKLE